MDNKNLNMVAATETDSISRALFRWLNTWPDKPVVINYESLPADGEGMALSTIQGAYKLKVAVTAAVFVLMTAVWCFVSRRLAALPLLRSTLTRYRHIAVPIVLIALGVYIWV